MSRATYRKVGPPALGEDGENTSSRRAPATSAPMKKIPSPVPTDNSRERPSYLFELSNENWWRRRDSNVGPSVPADRSIAPPRLLGGRCGVPAVTITRAPSGLRLGGRGCLARIRALADLSERPDKMPEVERLRENIVHLELLANGVARKTDRGDDDNRDAA